jgi:aminopeptidase
VNFGPFDVDPEWARHASPELLAEPSPLELQTYQTADAWMAISAPEGPRDGADLTPEAEILYSRRVKPISRRKRTLDIPWVGCQYPTQAQADHAGMSLDEFTDFLFGACLLDWDAETERMRRVADRFERASEVRVIAPGTDLRLGLAGRSAHVDDGTHNLPGGEFFFSPVEDATEGVIEFSEFPAVERGHECHGVRLVFEAGQVVDASARTEEDYLLAQLDADAGASRVGELGIGCNPRIRRHMKNTLFDEKIDGTMHVALGAGFPFIGGRNESVVHWDMVKDLRSGGRLLLDGELVQEDGRWLV